MSFLTPVFSILISPTGSAIYHILTLFALEAAFAIALGHWWRRRAESHSGRMAVAAGVAGAGRGILFALGTLGASGLFPASALLPPLDRAVTLLTLLLLGWALTFRQGNLFADVVASFGVVGVIIASLAAGVAWYSLGASGVAYNLFDTVWTIAKIAVIGITILGLLAVRPADWTFSLTIFATLLVGVALHFFNPIPTENYPAAERMAELIALPLVVVIVYRQALGSPPPKTTLRQSPPITAAEAASPPVTPPFTVPLESHLKPKPTLTPQAASALAAIALSDQETLFHRITEAVGKTMLADITLVFAAPDDKDSITCVSGYDLIREITLPKFTLATKKINTLVSAIQRGRTLRMRLDAHRSELLNIADALGVGPFDSAAMIPLRSGEKNFGGIMICAPHSQKDWTNEDHALLSSLATPIVATLLKVTSAATPPPAAAPNKDSEAKVRAAQEKANQLAAELEKARDEINQLNLKTDSLVALIQSQPSSTASQEQVDSLTQQLTAAQSEIALMGNQLAAAQKEIKSLNDKWIEEQRLFNQQASEHQAQDERLLNDITTLKQQLATAQLESKSLNERLFGAQRRFDEQASEHRADNERMTEEVDLLKQQLEAARAEINSLDEQLSEAQKSAAEGNELKQKLAATAQAEIKALNEKVVESQRHYQADADHLAEEITSLTEQLAAAQAEINSLAEKLQAAEQRAASKPAGTDRLSSEIASLKQQLTGADMEIESLHRENKQLSEIRSTGLFFSLASQSSDIIARTQDLRQPLTSIMGYADTLLKESVGILGKPQRSLLERIKAGTERMNVALDDLAHAAAISSKNVKAGHGSVAVADVIENAFTQLVGHFREKNIALRMDVADDLPPVHADEDAVYQIIASLLTNACNESKQNSDVVLTAQAHDEGYLLVTVHDSGESISPEEQENIFKRVYSESGSGLSLAKALTEESGGRIWVESKQGGNTFNVLLPTKNHANVS
jgi:signal transduction histidine kinase